MPFGEHTKNLREIDARTKALPKLPAGKHYLLNSNAR